jgi:hypothetical protein
LISTWRTALLEATISAAAPQWNGSGGENTGGDEQESPGRKKRKVRFQRDDRANERGTAD